MTSVRINFSLILAFDWVRVAGDVDVTVGDLISFGSVKTPTSAGASNGVLYLDEVEVCSCHLVISLQFCV